MAVMELPSTDDTTQKLVFEIEVLLEFIQEFFRSTSRNSWFANAVEVSRRYLGAEAFNVSRRALRFLYPR